MRKMKLTPGWGDVESDGVRNAVARPVIARIGTPQLIVAEWWNR